ncbi:putative fatty acyl-CoA reductase CG5065 [Bicyclus anynana]|uniref:Fatty acyl-CoA reductase n=1 Tax=Bicyclus anynana TaxID=110368 RepID=A0ABM3LIA1_BICAN|nr:putative fatty acyl-CoA reductase CG5065 [Bicyclus anynana]
MTFLEDRDLHDVPGIPEYYRGKTIFITGGTGFMGKVLIEKLLYSCTDLDRIYLLIRPKKGVKAEDRLAELYASSCFDRLRKEKPGVFESKVYFIAGDCSEMGLGLSAEDRILLINRTNIIYHAAASVRFDDLLKVSVKLNLRGAIELIELAKEMQHLESLVHISTSYCNTNRDIVEEVIYPPHADWREMLEICENIDDHTLNILTAKYLGEMPNTYSFVKQLAENMIFEQKGHLPVVIIRPSVVISTYREPMPGWVDNFNGPVGIMVASGKGILRTLYASVDNSLDYIPVDIAIKSIIVASWIRGTKKVEPTDDIPIYNTCNNDMAYSLSVKDIIKHGHEHTKESPLDNMVWSVGVTIVPNKSLHYITVILLHLLPAILLDTLLRLAGKKPMLLKIQRRIYISNMVLSLYLTKQWTFSITNFLHLRTKIKEEDKEHFYYVMEGVDVENDFFLNCIIGCRKYLLKEKEEDLPKAKTHYTRITLLANVVKYLFYGWLLWWFMHTGFMRNILLTINNNYVKMYDL